MKQCTKCLEVKPIDEFSWKNQANGVRRDYCKSCHAIYARQHYEENKNYYKMKARANDRINVQIKKQKISEYLSTHPCVDCGESDPVVLEFDHVLGVKRKNVSRLVTSSWSWKVVQAEIEKCEVRCANCHRRKTAKQFNWSGACQAKGVQTPQGRYGSAARTDRGP